MTYDRLLQRVWGLRGSGDFRRVRTAAKQLRRKLGDDANNPHLHPQRTPRRLPDGEGRGAGRRDGLATVRLILPGRIRVHRPGVAESLLFKLEKEGSYGKGVGQDAAPRPRRRHRRFQLYGQVCPPAST